jgi:transcriptional regulator with XRE-family HTH domain
MSAIGPTLREARLRDGWDIAEVEERTKIRAKYLRALENEEWSLLPGPTYTKGFLRTYGEVLGIDWRLLVDEYKREWEEPHEPDLVPVRTTLPYDPRQRGPRRLGRWIGALALIVVLALGFVLVGRLGSGTPAPKAPPAQKPAGVGVSVSGASGTTATAVSCLAGAPDYVAADCVSLRVVAQAAGLYVCVLGDGRRRLDGDLSLGARTAVYHARQFVLTLGSSAAVLVIDGKRVRPAASTGPLRYSITPAGRTRLHAPTALRCAA